MRVFKLMVVWKFNLGEFFIDGSLPADALLLRITDAFYLLLDPRPNVLFYAS